MLVYAYCVVRSEDAPPLPRASSLPSASPPHAVHLVRDLWVVVSEVPDAEYSPDAIAAGSEDVDWMGARGTAHHEVIAACAAARATVPFRLFTLFRDDDAALVALREAVPRVEDAVRRTSGRDEWVLRVFYDRSAAKETERAPVAASGAEYLKAKGRAKAEARERAEAARTATERLWSELSAIAAEVRRRQPVSRPDDDRPVLLDAALLVDRAKTGELRDALERFSASQGECQPTMTGPWPPYTFAHPDSSG